MNPFVAGVRDLHSMWLGLFGLPALYVALSIAIVVWRGGPLVAGVHWAHPALLSHMAIVGLCVGGVLGISATPGTFRHFGTHCGARWALGDLVGGFAFVQVLVGAPLLVAIVGCACELVILGCTRPTLRAEHAYLEQSGAFDESQSTEG